MKIFVYGTLKKSYGNHRIIADATYLGKATTEPRFTMLGLGGFPGVVAVGETAIHGEVYELPTGQKGDEMLYRLDRLEGHPSFYQRVTGEVTMEDGTTAEISWYVLPLGWMSRGIAALPSGVWGGR